VGRLVRRDDHDPHSDGITVLEGPVVDQAALHGLLTKLRDLGLPLLSLTQVDADPQTAVAMQASALTQAFAESLRRLTQLRQSALARQWRRVRYVPLLSVFVVLSGWGSH